MPRKLPLVCILSQINPANRVPSYFLDTHFNIIIQSRPRCSKWSLFFMVFLRTFLRISILSMPAACCTHIIVTDLMILIIFLEDYKIRNSSLCTFLRPPIISFLFISNIPPAHTDKDGYRYCHMIASNMADRSQWHKAENPASVFRVKGRDECSENWLWCMAGELHVKLRQPNVKRHHILQKLIFVTLNFTYSLVFSYSETPSFTLIHKKRQKLILAWCKIQF
jgi:hypothetical protein